MSKDKPSIVLNHVFCEIVWNTFSTRYNSVKNVNILFGLELKSQNDLKNMVHFIAQNPIQLWALKI